VATSNPKILSFPVCLLKSPQVYTMASKYPELAAPVPVEGRLQFKTRRRSFEKHSKKTNPAHYADEFVRKNVEARQGVS
jgi:hypothetical protein